MKNILVPVDFSEQAEYAAETAAQIARKVGAKVLLLHNIDTLILQSDAPAQFITNMEIIKALEHSAERQLSNWKKKPFFKGLDVTTEIKLENTFHGIVGETKKFKADLIVMGTKGTSGVKEFLIGSNTEKVVRWSEIPVLTVKERNSKFEINNVLFVSNFHGKVENTLTKIMSFLKLFNPKIHLLKVITPSNFEPTHVSLKIIEDFAEKEKLENYTVNTYNDVRLEDGIKHFDEITLPDLIIIPTHGRKGFSHFIYGSKTENAINHINAPILSYKIDEPE